MRLLIYIFGVSCLVVAGLAYPGTTLAVDCDDTGIITSFLFNPAELSPAAPTTRITVGFQYKSLGQDKLECFSENVLLRFFIIDPNSGSRLGTIGPEINLGAVGPTQSVTGQTTLTHAQVRQYITTSRPVQINVEAKHGVLDGDDILARRTESVSFLVSTTQTYACIAGDGRYACGSRSDCSDTQGCTNPAQNCRIITDTRLCGQTPMPTPSGTPGTSVAPGQPISYNFSIDNPLGGSSDLMGLIRAISQWIFNISIPVAVIFIIYGGLQFLLAGANPAMAARGKQTLKYATLGLAVVLIGYGFVTLIESIIKLGGSDTPSSSVTPRTSTSTAPAASTSTAPSPTTLPLP